MILEADQLAASYGDHPVLRDASLGIQAGDFLALCGPNGSGKSTLLRLLSRLMKPDAGRVLLHHAPLEQLSRRALARRLAIMPQSPRTPPSVSVRELVAYGRAPHTSWLNPASCEDRHIIDHAVATCDLEALSDREVASLSGGERQRAWLAMAIAQQPDVLLLDEPVSALDVGHQLAVMELLSRINRDRGTTIVIVLHDINLAARYCRSLAMLRDARVHVTGPMDDVLTAEHLTQVFGIAAQVRRLEGVAYPLCTFGDADGSRRA